MTLQAAFVLATFAWLILSIPASLATAHLLRRNSSGGPL